MSLTTAAMMIPASTARGRSLRIPAIGRNASTRTPTMAPDQRVCPPAILAIDVREKEPPIGKPPEMPEARLATPWLTSSRLALHGSRSAEANMRAIDAGSANPTSATTSAGTTSEGTSAHGRSSETGGKVAGISPTRDAE